MLVLLMVVQTGWRPAPDARHGKVNIDQPRHTRGNTTDSLTGSRRYLYPLHTVLGILVFHNLSVLFSTNTPTGGMHLTWLLLECHQCQKTRIQ